jgi:hypothetical protein
VRPDRELVGDGVLEDPGVDVVGDCAAPGRLADRIGEGFRAALSTQVPELTRSDPG